MFLYGVVAGFGYATFGDMVQSDILVNYPGMCMYTCMFACIYVYVYNLDFPNKEPCQC